MTIIILSMSKYWLKLPSKTWRMKLVIKDFLDMVKFNCIWIKYFLNLESKSMNVSVPVFITVPDVLTQSLGIRLKRIILMVPTPYVQQCWCRGHLLIQVLTVSGPWAMAHTYLANTSWQPHFGGQPKKLREGGITRPFLCLK